MFVGYVNYVDWSVNRIFYEYITLCAREMSKDRKVTGKYISQ